MGGVSAGRLQRTGRILAPIGARARPRRDGRVTALREPRPPSPDTSFGKLGFRFVDFGLGGPDLLEAMTLHAGKIVLAGVVLDDDGFKAALARLWNSLVFADGFESGTARAWTFGPP